MMLGHIGNKLIKKGTVVIQMKINIDIQSLNKISKLLLTIIKDIQMD
jgi:hypothetical protein